MYRLWATRVVVFYLSILSTVTYAGTFTIDEEYDGLQVWFGQEIPPTLEVRKVDPTLEGELLSIQIDGTFRSMHKVWYENLSTESTGEIHTSNTWDRLQLDFPRNAGSVLDLNITHRNIDDAVGPFDGILDFAGLSGRYYFPTRTRDFHCDMWDNQTHPEIVNLFVGDGIAHLPLINTNHFEYTDTTGNNRVTSEMKHAFRIVVKKTIRRPDIIFP